MMVHAEIIEWIDPREKKPTKLGETYLAVLAAGNALEWTSARPVMLEYGMFVGREEFTGYDHWANENISVDEDVLWWAELPEIPCKKEPPIASGLDRTTSGSIGQP